MYKKTIIILSIILLILIYGSNYLKNNSFELLGTYEKSINSSSFQAGEDIERISLIVFIMFTLILGLNFKKNEREVK